MANPSYANEMFSPERDLRVLLTERERQVLQLLAQGMSAKQIARCLDITPSTTSQHIGRVYEKLGVHNAVAAVRIAIRSGLVAA